MAWTTPITWTFGQTVTAAQLNSQIRDNLNETSAAKTTVAGSYAVGTAANAIAERVLGSGFTSATDTTASTSYADLAGGAGPSVTATTGTKALVWLSVSVANDTVNALSAMSFAVSGATTVAESDSAAIRHTSSTANSVWGGSYLTLQSLTAGSNTFLARYKVSAGTGSYGARRLVVMPF